MSVSEGVVAMDTDYAPESEAYSSFDVSDLRVKGFRARLTRRLVNHPEWLLAVLRTLCPIPKLCNWALVTRFEDVQEVLGLDEVFPVPFGDKVKLLNDGPNFLLGMKRGAEYWAIQRDVMEVFRLADIPSIVAPESARITEEILAARAGRIDAIQDLITLVPTRLCQTYYGVPVPAEYETLFGQWTIAMSTFMFGDPTDIPAYRRCAVAAGERVRALIDQAIRAGKASPPRGSDTILARLLAMQKLNPQLTDDRIRSYLIGMITGFVPTNTMAAGHILKMLFRRRDFMEAARSAAIAGDDETLRRCLFETLRFKPLNPGPFRKCAQDYRIAAGTSHAKTIPAGTKLLASTQSAMLDGRRVVNPGEFDPDRPAFHFMLFGYGLHWCTGAFIAAAQITQTFKALLMKPNLRPASGRDGRLRLLGPFPQHMTVEFEP
ncbi:MAG: cytochrome P450 [Terriglobales bacterium]